MYNQDMGELFYDADGSGWAPMIKFAQVNAGTVLTSQDLWLI